MRARVLALALVAVALALAALTPPAEAQRGLGRGRNRQPDAPANQQRQGGDQAQPSENQKPQEELGPGEYAFGGLQVLDAINRGEGPQALAYYEKAAQEAEQQGNTLRAARALVAATTAALRLGRYQKAIWAGTRALELYKNAQEPSPSDLMAWASVHAQLGAAYRNVGDLSRATQVLEEGLQFANTRLTGRREGQVQGYLLNNLAMVAYAQRDYQTALARNTQASQYFQEWEATMGRRASEGLRTNIHRWNAMSLYGIGRAQLALKHPDEAEAAFERSLPSARPSSRPCAPSLTPTPGQPSASPVCPGDNGELHSAPAAPRRAGHGGGAFPRGVLEHRGPPRLRARPSRARPPQSDDLRRHAHSRGRGGSRATTSPGACARGT
jgi:tetratricopeptide (TPR) repeat protein